MAEITQFNIGRGETFRILVTMVDNASTTPLDITNYTFAGQVRENYSTDEVAASFVITKAVPYTSGSIFVELTSDQTMDLSTARKYVYDINMYSGSITPTVRRLLEGYLTIRQTATR